MAKKAQKGKPAKKVVKPAKKAAAKPARTSGGKPVAKKVAKPVKKVAAKPARTSGGKVTKPVKKVVAKKAVAKKPVAKKTVAKKVTKPVKKVAAKKIVKKVVAKKVSKPVKKVIAKKPVAKKPVAKKVVKPAKKVIAKKVVKPAKKVVAKPVAKKPAAKIVAKPIVKALVKQIVPEKSAPIVKAIVPVAKKPAPVAKKKYDYDLDSDNVRERDEAPLVVEYRTPSILKPMGPTPKPHINTDKRTRYSDAELKEFKELILKKLAEAQKDFELLKSTLSHKDDHGTDDTSPTFKLLEDGSDVLSKEETAHLASRQEKFIQNLQNALIRIENKTYGICRVTGKLISKERLKSVPHATLAIEAKLDQNA